MADTATRVHVAVGVITDPSGAILIAQRPSHLHQGGFWEFPGGKVESGETVIDALKRELQEELGVTVHEMRPLIRVPYDYPEKSVLLDVWRVVSFSGEARGCEGQPVKWVSRHSLTDFNFPAANGPIVMAACLPDQYLITGDFINETDFLTRIERALGRGVRLIQLRVQNMSIERFSELAEEVFVLGGQYSARVLVNASPDLAAHLGADGVHLNASRLMSLSSRPLGQEKYVAASVHNEEQLSHAMKIGADFIVASPVLPTTSHPAATLLGWEGFQSLTRLARCPVYALGGMTPDHIAQSQSLGGQGIAAISSMW